MLYMPHQHSTAAARGPREDAVSLTHVMPPVRAEVVVPTSTAAARGRDARMRSHAAPA